jgi:16S rRNA (guanine966-N2)-methyltransferase
LRIIGGILKGKQLIAPKNLPVRPTTDFAKEGLFNILNNKIDFDEITVLDLFTGTGNMAFEFASRGAKKVTAIDMHSPCLNFVRDTAKTLGLKTIVTDRVDVFKYLSKSNLPFDLIFADPPYELANIDQISDLVLKNKLLNPSGWLIVEHGPKTNLSDKVGFIEMRKYGNVHFSFFQFKE